jgi:hypothetical protein
MRGAGGGGPGTLVGAGSGRGFVQNDQHQRRAARLRNELGAVSCWNKPPPTSKQPVTRPPPAPAPAGARPCSSCRVRRAAAQRRGRWSTRCRRLRVARPPLRRRQLTRHPAGQQQFCHQHLQQPQSRQPQAGSTAGRPPRPPGRVPHSETTALRWRRAHRPPHRPRWLQAGRRMS